MVCLDAKRRPGNWHHVFRYARDRLFRAFPALDLHRQLGPAKGL